MAPFFVRAVCRVAAAPYPAYGSCGCCLCLPGGGCALPGLRLVRLLPLFAGWWLRLTRPTVGAVIAFVCRVMAAPYPAYDLCGCCLCRPGKRSATRHATNYRYKKGSHSAALVSPGHNLVAADVLIHFGFQVIGFSTEDSLYTGTCNNYTSCAQFFQTRLVNFRNISNTYTQTSDTCVQVGDVLFTAEGCNQCLAFSGPAL